MPYPVGNIAMDSWTALPDSAAMDRLLTAAREFWSVPEGAEIIAAPGASALIARVPALTSHVGRAYIPGPTYNEHAAAIRASTNWEIGDDPDDAQMHIYVHPNNPDGRTWEARDMGGRTLTVIDESFCDVTPGQSHVGLAGEAGVIVLKSFGKFWGLAGLRLGFAIGSARSLAPAGMAKTPLNQPESRSCASLADLLGPWAVSGPALEIGARALEDQAWADATRARLADDAERLDTLMRVQDARIVGGTTLFRLYEVENARAWQERLAKHQIWSRTFPYDPRWLRLGIPAPGAWARVEAAMA